ncbi:DNA ligase D [Sphingomonas histidinilytica]|uniref:DNA ligase (ATP) n=1 Tax=Rhizorhabdus histidinilytica TaxID=439228 RepID=A0A1T5B368_9SPHN|nr:DNA ligase D [Rhizorhabdus histidinilytica]MBO9379733.1 DNA ligase D [Rhizorhabdus histidinilytica]SKB41664.1 ATP-dependent DNA ligase LigD phosphoesterase module /ATP-dependent DNA ligase LigD polymerase module [Rhizorhabdus histidinilytica]
MAALEEYNRKRDFAKTREPAGKLEKANRHRFIVQKHDATRLHYDFRLEMDGVLKSWAVTRGPSLDPDDKRLAVRTEDHPVSYGGFEGTIPEGEYGGGTVMLWDEGTWAPVEGKSERDLDRGHLHFTLDGQRMKGEWLLVRIKGRPGEKRENWLLRKIDDAEAGGSDDLVAHALTSVKTGRTMAEIAADKAGESSLKGKRGKAFDAIMAKSEAHNAQLARRSARGRGKAGSASARPPAFRKPQLATLVDHVPTGSQWIHEIKFDGYRALIAVAGARVKIFTRTGLDWTDRFAPVAEAVAALGLPPALIDGEIVSLGADGNPSFSALQKAIKGEGGGGGFELFAFDLLSLDGEDLVDLGTVERKARLAGLLPRTHPMIHYADHVVGAGEKLFDAMCRAGQEGIISKRADARYRAGRTTNWLKVKCTRRQEFVIIGWSRSESVGRPFRALLLAQQGEDGLVYAGKVGTGFDRETMEMLAGKFAARARKKPPAEVPRAEARGASWIRPDLVAEIGFAEFTHEGILRQASFIGLRSDKKAAEVTAEKPMPVEEATRSDETPVKISNPDRVIFPEAKATKGDLARYYQAVGPIILPWLGHRPVSLVRCPQGRAKQCFFQKHDSGSFGEHVHHVPIQEKDGKTEDYLYVDDVAGILACVQMGTIEFHGWGSRVERIEAPDRMIFDLDPDVGLDFADVRKAAKDIRTLLSDIGLTSFAMLSGGKGVHVVVPLRPEAEWPAVKDFAHRFAEAMAQAEPDRFVATMAKAKRVGRIFIDYLRNQRGATAVVPYGARARENAPVAAPVSWSELDDFDKASAFTIKDADLLLKRASSKALKGWGVADQTLPDL